VKYSLITLFTLFSVLTVNSQSFYSVIAENGLIVRKKPAENSERLGKFFCGESVELVEKTKVQSSITHLTKTLEGYWYLVKSTSRTTTELKGYVYSRFLLKNRTGWDIGVTCNDHKIVCSTKLSTEHTELELFNFQIEEQEKHVDTLIIHEAVFNEIGDKLLNIKPKEPSSKVDVFYTRIETLNDWGTAKNNEGQILKWKGNKPFTQLDAANESFYRIPLTDYENVREATAKELDLERAPNWDYVGEGWWIPRYEYKGIIAPYEIKSVLLKILVTDVNNDTRTEYIEIRLSYGC